MSKQRINVDLKGPFAVSSENDPEVTHEESIKIQQEIESEALTEQKVKKTPADFTQEKLREEKRVAANQESENKKMVKEKKEVKEDRSTFNCPDCKGEGLANSHLLCAKCGGTGKIN